LSLKKKIPIFVLTIKGSSREKIIRKRLNKLGLRYKIIYGINAKIKKNIDFLKKIYDKKRANNLLERDLNYSDIACSFGHIKIYKHIVKKKIKYAIIMEDDCHPSKIFLNWSLINYNLFNKLDFVQFYSNSGLIFKKPHLILGNNFFIHKAKTHLPLATCYQINLKSCKFFQSVCE
jgi:GR25 family glycosyltransferase involved in LPS biosynthesis